MQFAWPLFLSPEEAEYENTLAQSYEGTPDALEHTITLRSGLLFHDGSPIDADAVAENLRACFFEDHPLRDDGAYLMNLLMTVGTQPGHTVTSVDVIDELTLRLVLSAPNVDLRSSLGGYPILNPTILSRPDYGTDPGALRDAGSGPFRVTSFSPSSFVEFERFDGFFDDVLLDRLRFETIADVAAMALALRSGEVDVGYELSQADHAAFAQDPSFHEVFASQPANNVRLAFAPPKEPDLEDPRVREAIWLALNRDAYREAFFIPGAAHPSTQPILFDGTRGYFADLDERPYDLERARQLLEEAGVTDLRLSAIGPPATGPISAMGALFEAIAADLAAVGIDLDITITDAATADAEFESHDFTVTNLDGVGPFIQYLILFVGFEGGFQAPDPRAEPDVARLLDAAATTPDVAEQNRLLRELMQLHHDEIMMGIPIALVASSAIARAHVRDFRMTPQAIDPQHRTWLAEP